MRAAWWFASIAVAILLTASMYAVPAAICRLMNRARRRVTSADPPDRPTAVVLLSGRVETRTREGRPTAVLGHTCEARVREAARIYELIAPEWVISAGGLPAPKRGGPTCAELMRRELVRLGVPTQHILVETGSRTTRDTAVRVSALLQSLEARHALIVTSEVHIPRALRSFRAQGVAVTPAGAVDPDASRRWPAWIIPTKHGLRFSNDVLHEVLGLLAYRLRGWLA